MMLQASDTGTILALSRTISTLVRQANFMAFGAVWSPPSLHILVLSSLVSLLERLKTLAKLFLVLSDLLSTGRNDS